MRRAICFASCSISLCASLSCATGRPAAKASEATESAEAIAAGPFALLPLTNLGTGPAPLGELGASLEAALRDHGVPLVEHEAVEVFLARHRLRWTGGVDRASAEAACHELGVRALIVASVDVLRTGAPPLFGLSLRLVSADAEARILWTYTQSRAGDDAPGWFERGLVADVRALEEQMIASSASALSQGLEQLALPETAPRETPSRPGRGESRFAPRVSFRSREPFHPGRIVVLPFADESGRRGAGDLAAIAFIRALSSAGFRVVEPGVVRDELLRFRLASENGFSLDQARVVLELVDAEVVVGGTVHTFEDPIGGVGAPRAELTVTMLDREDDDIVWESTSSVRGDQGVWFFDLGRVSSAEELLSRMANGAVERMTDPRPRTSPQRQLGRAK